jgi:hypothetical protein
VLRRVFQEKEAQRKKEKPIIKKKSPIFFQLRVFSEAGGNVHIKIGNN